MFINYLMHGVLTLLNPLPLQPLGFILHLGFIPHFSAHCSWIYKRPQEMPVRDLWKCQNFQVADKCLDITFTKNIL